MSIRNNIEKANYMRVSGNYNDYGKHLIDLCELYINSNNVTLEGLENFNSFMPTNQAVIDEKEDSKCLMGVSEYKENVLEPLIQKYKSNDLENSRVR